MGVRRWPAVAAVLGGLVAGALFLTAEGAAQAPPVGDELLARPALTATPRPIAQRPPPYYGPTWRPPAPEGPPSTWPPGWPAPFWPPYGQPPLPPPPGARAPQGGFGGAEALPGAPARPAQAAPPAGAPSTLSAPAAPPPAPPAPPAPPGMAAPGPAQPGAAAPPPGDVGPAPVGPAPVGPAPVGIAPLAAPSAPASSVQPPCAWHLAGVWQADGWASSGSGAVQSYRLTVSVRQFGSHLVATHADESITYYGYCSGDTVELEVWTGWDYIGRQTGRVAPDGLQITLRWALWSPEPLDGHEVLSGRARRLR